jgi:aryl-alcohol dehydrogenase-like predicted oxidoreductase
MEYRRMGRSGLQLSVLSLGSWVTFHKQIDDSSADELMGIAYDNGINFFDNAEGYALGESEKMMGRVLKKKNWDRTSYTVSSKVFFGWRGKDNKPNQTGLSRIRSLSRSITTFTIRLSRFIFLSSSRYRSAN